MLRGMRLGTWSGLTVIVVLVGAGSVAPRQIHAQAAQAQAQGEAPAANPTLPPPPPPAEPAAAAPAASSGATVHLKNGGLVRGELIELQPGTSARLKLADGTIREVPWAEIDHIDDPSLPPPPPAASAAPTLPLAAAGPGAPTPMAVANADQIRRLREERDDIDNTGPALMMILGGGAALFIGFPGLIVLAASDVCDDSSSDYADDDCGDARRAGAVMTVIGVVGAGVAVWGLIKVQSNRRERARLDQRIRDLKGEAALSVDLYPRKEGLSLGLTLRM